MVSGGSKKVSNKDRIRAWLREARAAAPLPESIGAPRRPGIFVLLFWGALAAALATWAFDLFGEGRRFGLVSVSDRKSTRLNSSHANISYAVFCLKKKNKNTYTT